GGDWLRETRRRGPGGWLGAGYVYSTLLSQRRIETASASGLVRALSSDEHSFIARDEPLRMIRRSAADHADGQRLRDVLRNRQQLRHWIERLAQVVLVEPGDDDSLALIGERAADSRQVGIEELPFVDAHHLRFGEDALEEIARRGEIVGRDPHLAVR